MADNVTLSSMTGGSVVAADERTINSVVCQIQRVGEIGSSALASGQVAPTSVAGTLIAARETRKRVIILNDGVVDVFIGPATVTTANGFRLVPGSSIMLITTVLIQGITASGTGAIDYLEEYDA